MLLLPPRESFKYLHYLRLVRIINISHLHMPQNLIRFHCVNLYFSSEFHVHMFFFNCLYILPCLIIFQLIVEAILSISANENIESLFTLIQSTAGTQISE